MLSRHWKVQTKYLHQMQYFCCVQNWVDIKNELCFLIFSRVKKRHMNSNFKVKIELKLTTIFAEKFFRDFSRFSVELIWYCNADVSSSRNSFDVENIFSTRSNIKMNGSTFLNHSISSMMLGISSSMMPPMTGFGALRTMISMTK